jgi:hypothetical protein
LGGYKVNIKQELPIHVPACSSNDDFGTTDVDAAELETTGMTGNPQASSRPLNVILEKEAQNQHPLVHYDKRSTSLSSL